MGTHSKISDKSSIRHLMVQIISLYEEIKIISPKGFGIKHFVPQSIALLSAFLCSLFHSVIQDFYSI